jgi:ribose 1,5-bisphosphate isomerase
MTSDPPVDTLIMRIEQDLIGGAADMAKETARALRDAVRGSTAIDAAVLRSECLQHFDRIIAATPSVMPVTFVLHLIGSELEQLDGAPLDELRSALIAGAENAEQRIAGAVERVAAVGSDLLADGEVLFTYSMSSTVYAIVRAARAAKKAVSVVTTESRPGNEGLRTIEELAHEGVHVTVGVDAALGLLLRNCTSVCVGGDTITSTGDALCKVGSFPVALAARFYGIPFRVAVDLSKFDANTLLGVPLKIREMPATDILPGGPPPHVSVRNPAFEVIPARLIEAFVTDIGVVAPAAAYTLMDRLPHCSRIAERVAAQYRGEPTAELVA